MAVFLSIAGDILRIASSVPVGFLLIIFFLKQTDKNQSHNNLIQ
jgi:hypothetical protein